MSRLFYPTFENVLSNLSGSGERLVVAHRAIFHALKTRAPGEASEWMTKHIRDFRRGYEAAGLDLRAAINPLSPR